MMDTLLLTSNAASSCPGIVYAIRMRDNSLLDSSIFTESTNVLHVESSDLAKVGVYELSVDAYINGYEPTSKSTLDFEVTLIDSCALATLTMNPL